jgi:hypothetical protein
MSSGQLQIGKILKFISDYWPLQFRGIAVAQNEKYQRYAEEAWQQFERASSDDDKAAWLLIAQSWLNLLPQSELKTKEPSH